MSDPTRAELDTMDTLDKVATWVAIAAPLVQGIRDAVGIPDMAAHPRHVGCIKEADYQAVIPSIVIGDDHHPPSLYERTQIVMFHRVAQLVSGTALLTDEQDALDQKIHDRAVALAAASSSAPPPGAVARAGPPAVGTSPLKKVKMNVLDQGNEAEIESLSGSELQKKFMRWHTANGGDPQSPVLITPLKGDEPSSEQLTAMDASLRQGSAWADFASFVPFSDRVRRRDPFKALLFNARGELIPTEIKGPSTFEAWEMSWRVYKVCMVMNGAASMATLDMYHDHIKKLHVRYGAHTWGLLYQSDHRARLEEIERIRRRASVLASLATGANAPTVTAPYPYSEVAPWDYCFYELCKSGEFWKEEHTDGAMMILAKVTGPATFIEGDAPMDGGTLGGASQSSADRSGGQQTSRDNPPQGRSTEPCDCTSTTQWASRR